MSNQVYKHETSPLESYIRSRNLKFNEYTIEMYIEYGLWEVLVHVTSHTLLTKKYGQEKTLLENLLDRKLVPKLTFITDVDIVKILVDYKVTSLYNKILPSVITEKSNSNKTYFELILEQKKENPNIELYISRETTSHYAKMIISLYKYGFKELAYLSPYELLMPNMDEKKTLLDYLLEEDKDYVLKNILTEETKNDYNIQTAIKMHELKQRTFTAGKKLDTKFNQIIEQYKQLSITEEQQEILKRFYEVMNDGMSDTKLIDAVVADYTYLFAFNNPTAYDILRIIEMKKAYPNFKIIKSEKGKGSSYFNDRNIIAIEEMNMGIINHEIAHALHSNFQHITYPENLDELINKIAKSRKFKKQVSKFTSKLNQISDYTTKAISKIIDEEYEKHIPKYDQTKFEKTLKNSNFPIHIKNRILSSEDAITIEEFISKEKEIRKSTVETYILRTTFGNYLAIADIIDGITRGAYTDGFYRINGKNLKGKYGHGMYYYERGTKWIFTEMIAQYSLIIKSSSPNKGIQELRKYVGDELVDLIEEYYNKNIAYKHEEDLIR